MFLNKMRIAPIGWWEEILGEVKIFPTVLLYICEVFFVGVYQPSIPDIYIDISDVSSLVKHSQTKDNLILGANMNLSDTLELLKKVGTDNSNFSYLIKVAEHILKVASVPVRNVRVYKSITKLLIQTSSL